MDVSIIVPLTGDPERALRTLEALAGLPDEPRHEVVLVDDASDDLAPLLARVTGDATVIRRDERAGAAAAVRAGLQAATGAVAVVLAEGALVHPGAVALLHDALADAGLAGATADAPHPTAAHAVAWRRHEHAGADAVPDAPDDRLVAAIAFALAPRGRVAAVPGAVVVPPAVTVEDTVARARRTPGEAVELSVVIPTLDAAGPRLRGCLRALQRHTTVPHELIVIDNGAPPQGFTDPVNAGLRAARGRFLVVCNDDVHVDAGWWEPLRAALDGEDPAAVVFPRTVDGAMREDFAAWCFAFRRDTLEAYAVAPGEFFHPELRVWFQDTDLLARLRAAGRPPRLVPESTIRHGLSETVASPDPQLRAWIDAQIRRDQVRFEQLHGAAVPGAAR
ncbi:glycosyltransferase [Paraconexibacter antarcticus]|uniref:Glycosyltransferase n=1 Tax=Paraconexibacter antarcticus TaxID=2949664 RepID=A0ABY5DVL5_9ACTN|nr:glycosyltransferase [Paraconexibacter antarcticus]UTI64695.1 glycosyltransferase [Paraconexibacter antarcticus]